MREGTQWRSWGSVGEDPVPEDPPLNKLNKFLVRVHNLFMNLFKKDFCTFFVLRTVHELFMKLFKLVKFDSWTSSWTVVCHHYELVNFFQNFEFSIWIGHFFPQNWKKVGKVFFWKTKTSKVANLGKKVQRELRMNVSLMEYIRTEYDNLHSHPRIEVSETHISKEVTRMNNKLKNQSPWMTHRMKSCIDLII